MPFCPICDCHVADSATECGNCSARFDKESGLIPSKQSASYPFLNDLPVKNVKEDPAKGRSILWSLATVVVVLSVIAQLIIIGLLKEHHNTPSSESRGWQGMGILVVIFASLWVVVPGTLIAAVRAFQAGSRLNSEESAKIGFFIYLSISVMPLICYWFLQLSDKPKAPVPERPPSANDERIAGAAWAADEGISSIDKCNQGSPDFVAGCKSYVTRWGK